VELVSKMLRLQHISAGILFFVSEIEQ